MKLSILDHTVDIFLVDASSSVDLDGLFFAGAFILGRNVQNAVRIDIEGYLYLRNSARCGWNTYQIKSAKALVIWRIGRSP